MVYGTRTGANPQGGRNALYGAHSNNNEYIFVNSIAPKLYLATHMVMDEGSSKLAW